MLSTVTALKNNVIDSIAIGGFDGMHIAHQRLFSHLGEKGAIIVIETGYANLTPLKEREHYSHYPIHYFKLNTIRHLSGEAFIAKLQKKFPHLKKIVVGYDFHFGKNRKYSIDALRVMFRGSVEVVDEVMLEDESVHSHKVRAFLSEAKIKKANHFLGRHYRVNALHVKGQGIGKKELFATVNLECEGFLLPKVGVYATLTQLDDEEHFHPSISFIGFRESTDGEFAFETHILDGEVECLSKARVSFIDFIRDNCKFDSLELLKKQIALDIQSAKKAHIQLTF